MVAYNQLWAVDIVIQSHLVHILKGVRKVYTEPLRDIICGAQAVSSAVYPNHALLLLLSISTALQVCIAGDNSAWHASEQCAAATH